MSRFLVRIPGLPYVTHLRSRVLGIAMIAALTAGMTAALPAAAALYKWTDANGRVVYSDQPPMGNTKAETLTGAPPPANPGAVKEMATKDAEFKKRQADQAETVKKADKQRTDAERLIDQCAQARGQIKQLGAEQVEMYRYNAKGDRVILDAATRGRDRDMLEKWAAKNNCAA